MRYQVTIYRSDEGITIGVPALPGCWSEGNAEEALINIQDSIQEYLAALNDRLQGIETREFPQDSLPTALQQLAWRRAIETPRWVFFKVRLTP